MIVQIDFETRSKVDLPDTGVQRYARDESTDILCMAWAIDNQEPVLWVKSQKFPEELEYIIGEKSKKLKFHAWNAQFEIAIWYHVGVKRYGWPEVPADIWHDTMGDAAACSFPLKLAKAAAALGVDEQKDTDGTRLINLLSKPKKDGSFWEYEDKPEDFRKLYTYCKQDVRTERAVYHALPYHVEGQEDKIQRATWKMNEIGVPVDTYSVGVIKQHLDVQIDMLDSEIDKLTDGVITSATQRDRILKYLDMNAEAMAADNAARAQMEKPPRWSAKKVPGMVLTNMQGETLGHVLKEWDISELDRKLLEIYQAKNHASVAKFAKILSQVCEDDRVKDNIQYHGAGTGRDAARGFQIQNLPRETEKDPEKLLQDFYFYATEVLDVIYHVLEKASTLIRPMIKAPHDKILYVSDYGQVEARGSAWAAKEEDILQNFRDGIPVYEAQASSMYHTPIDEVDSTQRQYGKLAVLACGYQGSHRALTQFAEGYGLTIERKEAGKVVRAFRSSRPKLVSSWDNFGEAAMAAVDDPGAKYQVRDAQHAVFQMQGKHLTLELPSGRKIFYPEARNETVTVKYQDEETGEWREFQTRSVTFKKLVKAHWVRGGIHGGNLFQNYVQAICRDLLMAAHLRVVEHGYTVVGRIHDELITLQDRDDPRWSLEQLNKLMCVLPDWAEDFPISAAGYASERYKK